MSKEKDNLIKLKETVEILKRERERLNKKTNDFVLKNKKDLNAVFDIKFKIRDILEKNKKFLVKIRELKTERNALNQRVSDINNDISELKKDIDGISSKDGSSEDDSRNNAITDLKKKIEKLEWTIQTKPVSIKQEDKMQDQLSQLVKSLGQIKEKTKIIRKLKRIKIKKNELKQQADEKHNELLEESNKSEKLYNGLLELKNQRKEEEEKAKPLLEELNQLKKTADSAHQKYIEYVEVLKKEEKSIRKEIEKEEKEEKEEETKKIYDSFKKGNKLSLSDLMLIENKLDDELEEGEKIIEKSKDAPAE
ncbi:MAG: hypothetical protein KAR87_03030 [Candidatus Aenigmarchaeota archaeon]|nr:hypothetical protein [Candidatus Aenigmarchaeota archaeon]